MKHPPKKIYIYGKNVVREALMHAPQIIRAIYFSPMMSDSKLMALAYKSGIKTEKIDPKRISSQVEGNAPHQGIIAHIALQGIMVPFENFIKNFTPGQEDVLVYLDGVQDPHNVGTIIRTASAFGARAVLWPERGASQVTAGVIKASAGAAFSIPLVLVKNPQQALAELKHKGIKIYGLAGEGASNITEEKFAGGAMLVMGNEADGISPMVRPLCNTMLKIPINPRVESLNVASAATAALFAWSMKHQGTLK
jgi:23S rRNA (guanosine2251-2'-O)-methyltransferase